MGERFSGPFLISAYEAIALGLGYHHPDWAARGTPPPIVDKVKALWSNPIFLEKVGSGISASARLLTTLRVGREIFQP